MRSARLWLGALSLVAGVWAAALYAGLGQSISIGSWRISSRNPSRPLLACVAAALAYAYLSGVEGLGKDAARLRRALASIGHASVRSYERVESRLDPRLAAIVIAAATVAVALWFRESTAGGSDAFSYVTQAELWKANTPGLRIEMPVATEAPWPDAFAAFVPFGYRATIDRRAIVPVTAPGLPLMMAALAAIAGHCAMSWVVPLMGGLLVWGTFLIGRQVHSDAVGLSGAWLVATSPTFLAMSKWIMSDVPAAAFWALAMALVMRGSTFRIVCGGLCASAAILVRPNLLPIAIVLGLWVAWSERAAGLERLLSRVAAFISGALPGCAAIAIINSWLYGSAGASGYGDVNSLFASSNIAVNLRHYLAWLSATQTPVAIAGAAALLLPWRRIWPTHAARGGARLLAWIMIVIFAVYAAYTPFQEWWYLRFLLPAWPAIFIGTAALIVAPFRSSAPWLRALSTAIVIGLGGFGIDAAMRLGVYPPGEGERRYATIAELVARVTEPSAAIITTAHVGPMRYYGGRLTMRYDILDRAWLDRAVDWLEMRGKHPYFLLEEQEVEEFQKRFAAGNRLGRLDMTPTLVYEAHQISGRVYLFDALNPRPQTWEPAPIRDPQPRCPLPARTSPDYR